MVVFLLSALAEGGLLTESKIQQELEVDQFVRESGLETVTEEGQRTVELLLNPLCGAVCVCVCCSCTPDFECV